MGWLLLQQLGGSQNVGVRRRRWRERNSDRSPQEESPWLNVSQVARYLNLHLMTVYRYLKTGEMPASKVGGRWRVHRKDLEAWIEAGETGSRKRVLIVDDEPEVADFFAEILSREGALAQVAQSAEEALQQVSQQPFDLVFLDLFLPGMDGAEAFGQIRKLDPDVPVVLITGYPDSDLVAKALRFGAVFLLFKPLAAEEIARLVRSVRRRTTGRFPPPQPGGQ
ncbi:MAG: response regulator [Armatimonadetes bacterium]|nr:response regulator [Armatimonadota bacterium]MDW8121589.1 response regulator [Armatimonadota bacterium]